MSNRIDSNPQGLVSRPDSTVGGTDRASGTGAETTKPSDSGNKPVALDSVVLTDRSKLLASLEQEMAAAPAFDTARVDAVKADIESGNYEINLDNLAELMLRSEIDLGD